MRFDLISIFPQFFEVLDLSLMGKAKQSGAVSIGVHDLRDWTEDRHRTVDDTPYGGGAGMVMRPDVWGKAIDDVLQNRQNTTSKRVILAVPTPSGTPLTQAHVRDLARADQIIVACGRYEGIDQRVVDHYSQRANVSVFEYSIGDYVLNGGETAGLVLVETIARLLDGFMGNPESLTEESFEGNVLEYPSYTRPPTWRDLAVPDVLQGGNHAAIERWREAKSLEKTARVRPDLIAQIDPRTLTLSQREALAQQGWIALADSSQWDHVSIRPATLNDVEGIAHVAATTFPDACPPYITAEAAQQHIETNLNAGVITRWINEPRYRVLVADFHGQIIAYTMVEFFTHGTCPDDVPSDIIEPAPTYFSKLYTAAQWRGTGLSGAIFEAAITDARPHAQGRQMILGTNAGNKRARKFYRRHGWETIGKRTFTIGNMSNKDVVLARDI